MSPSTSRHTLSTVLHACLFVACLTVAMVDAQNYHFSNGWHPGGKRSTQNDCLFRPQIKLLIEKLIEDEVTRIQSTCSGLSHSISDVPSYLQSKKESTWPLDTDQD